MKYHVIMTTCHSRTDGVLNYTTFANTYPLAAVATETDLFTQAHKDAAKYLGTQKFSVQYYRTAPDEITGNP